ncbi:MAG: radical SAM protein [Nitrospinae bacterium]|nr:radical SAM protein [Nitrospinota bacterium]
MNEIKPELLLENALRLAITNNPRPKVVFRTTTNRTITRRGVIWLGQTCNLRCQFCYFINRINSKDHPEHTFMPPEKVKKILKTLVDVYRNNAIDIQGGEPTIYKGIFDLIQFCNEIGLRPTLITNALVLAKKEICYKYRDAGIRDFLVSVHGLGEVHDRLVGRNGAHVNQMKALGNLREVGIPFRFNCVLSKPVIDQLPYISRLAVETGSQVVNFLTFNPFEDQSQKGIRNTTNVPRYFEIKEKLTEALDILDSAGIEANVRYFPICMLEERHRKSAYNFQQLPYDHHEWDYASWSWTGLQPQRMKEGEPSDPIQLTAAGWILHFKKPLKVLAKISFLRPLLYKAHQLILSRIADSQPKDSLYRNVAKIHAEVHCNYSYGTKCNICAAKGICDGFHGDYAEIFGTEEAIPIQSECIITDPLYYIRHQYKIVEEGDEDFALHSSAG